MNAGSRDSDRFPGVGRLTGLTLAAVAAGLLASCAAPAPSRCCHDAGRREGHRAARAEQVLRRLGKSREDCLRTGDPAKVFAVFYCHVTSGILDMVRAGRLRHPDFWLDELAAFHAAWERSADPGGREAHWIPYYQKAGAITGGRLRWHDVASLRDFASPRSLLALGAEAHIETDLPRTIAEVRSRHADLWREHRDELAADFESMSPVFGEASRRGFADCDALLARHGDAGLRRIPFRDAAAAAMVRKMRRRAWATLESISPAAVPSSVPRRGG